MIRLAKVASPYRKAKSSNLYNYIRSKILIQ